MRALILAATTSLAVSSGAAAASTASLQGVHPAGSMVILDGRVWWCDGGACAAAGQGRRQGLIRECARVARKLGPLSAYARDGVALDRASLDRCNREARVR